MNPNLNFQARACTPGAPLVAAALHEAAATAAATADLPHHALDIAAERTADVQGADVGHPTPRTEPCTDMLPKPIQLDIFGGNCE